MDDKFNEFNRYYGQNNPIKAREVLESCNEFELSEILFHRDSLENTYLLETTHQGLNDFSELLIEFGSDVNAMNVNKQTPLIHAAKNNAVPIIEKLLKFNADINLAFKDKKGKLVGSNALMWACQGGHLEAVNCLLSHSAEVNYQNDLKHTSLMLACKAPHNIRPIITSLLNFGAQVDRQAILGNNVFIILAKINDLDLLSFCMIEEKMYHKQLLENIIKDDRPDITGIFSPTLAHIKELKEKMEFKMKLESELTTPMTTTKKYKI